MARAALAVVLCATLVAALSTALGGGSRREAAASSSSPAASTASASTSAAVADGPRPPHVVFLLADDLGYNDLGFSHAGGGAPRIESPALDALAAQGVVLTNVYAMPMCTATRAALLTGRHPTRTGLHHFVLLASQPTGLPLDVTLLPEVARWRAALLLLCERRDGSARCLGIVFNREPGATV